MGKLSCDNMRRATQHNTTHDVITLRLFDSFVTVLLLLLLPHFIFSVVDDINYGYQQLSTISVA